MKATDQVLKIGSQIIANYKKIFQNPSACQTYDVVTFEAHDSIPRMDQIMWPRHCVQVFNTQYLNKGAGIGRQRLIIPISYNCKYWPISFETAAFIP